MHAAAWRLVRHLVHMPHDPIMVLGYGVFSAVDADGDALAGGEYEITREQQPSLYIRNYPARWFFCFISSS